MKSAHAIALLAALLVTGVVAAFGCDRGAGQLVC